MLGVGGTEIIIIGLLFLLIFGPSKLPQMARDIGKFVGEARRSIDEFKDELTMEPDPDEKPARRRESRNGSKKSTASLKNKKADEENSDASEDPEATEDSDGKAAPDSRTASRSPEAKEEESELRDL
jgi:sec-independent protein translocase protein TatB